MSDSKSVPLSARRERERTELQDKMVDAARTLLTGRGYAAVTMREIARRIEYSPTAIYLHFKDKDALIRELCRRDFQEMAGELAACAEIADPVERLTRLGERFVEFGLGQPHLYRMIFLDAPPPADDGDARDPDALVQAALRNAFAQAREGGRLRGEFSDPDLATQTFRAALHGAIALELAPERPGRAEGRPARERIKLLIGVLLRGMTQPAKARAAAAAPPGLFDR